MSTWTHIEGEHTSKKASIRKIIEFVLDGEDVVAEYDHNEFWVRFEHGGEKTANSISESLITLRVATKTRV